ncbi:GYD domain-containing protein [Actinoallomurus purpureus]|uniref:GYD domain-containing protein n=1 Tax=Actinoallomurus purpureus TaxID=478114 RepID=UPI0020936556|nr:GYD domain-containing protein [Actinoallomurus purpureus]MCO6009456.1 GYD domain-containing protein [Actinoallomurus purpureus]
MATYMLLCKWTVLGAYLSMGRYDQIVLIEAPDDEVAAKFAVFVAGRGYAETETLRCFSMDETLSLL